MGAHHALLSELRNEDQTSFKNFVRMDPAAFDELLMLVTPLIKRRDTCLRDAITAAEWLSLTLRFVATGKRKKSTDFKNHPVLSVYMTYDIQDEEQQ